MTPAEVVANLRVFNDWRHGELDDLSMPDPREIGEAIDAAVEMIERLEAAEKERDFAKAEIARLHDDIRELTDVRVLDEEDRDRIVAWRQDGYGDNPDANPLYALPGAHPAQSVLEGWPTEEMTTAFARVFNVRDQSGTFTPAFRAALAAAPEAKP